MVCETSCRGRVALLETSGREGTADSGRGGVDAARTRRTGRNRPNDGWWCGINAHRVGVIAMKRFLWGMLVLAFVLALSGC